MKKTLKRSLLLIVMLFGFSYVMAGCGKNPDADVNAEGLHPEPHVAPQITQLTETSTTFTWESLGTNAQYNVYKASSRNGNYTKIATTTETSYTDTTEGSSTKLALSSYYRITTISGDYETRPSLPVSQETMVFSDFAYIFSPTDNAEKINEELADVFFVQEAAQFESGRYAFMFKPDSGEDNYKDVAFNIGFYTDAMGLGGDPTKTTVGNVTIDANWLGVQGADGDSNATCNFWRGISNLTLDPTMDINPTTGLPRDKNTLWAVSQAAPMRRMNIIGNLQLATLTGSKNWGSGGFIADTKVSGTINLYGQQQFYFRNVEANRLTSANWNTVYQGTEGPIDLKTDGKTTVLDTTPTIKERPLLFVDANNDYKVFVPSLLREADGVSWGEGKPNNGMGAGKILDLSEFYIAKWREDDDVTLNKALAEGKNILFTPGIYRINAPLLVSNPDTVVMGLGYATIENQNNTESMIISAKGSVNNVNISGIIFDAGGKGSPTMLKVGADRMDNADKNNPIILSDLFFRVGGDIVATADVCVEINIDNTIGDDFWVWRADHGAEVTWLKNVTKNGLIVNGNDVTIYALMCEHFHEYQTIWNGENGRLYFYQSEIPYDVINQEDWIAPDGANGFASYKVADNVRNHEAYGLGVYSCFTRTGEPPKPPLSGYADGLEYVYLDSAIEVPNSQGVKIINACTVYLAADNSLRNRPAIKNVVNNWGEAILAPVDRQFIEYYCDPINETPAIMGNGTELKEGKHANINTVTMTSPKDGATILYTLDGSNPIFGNPSLIEYNGAIDLSTVSAVTIRAVLAKNNSLSQEKTINITDDIASFQPVKASSTNGSQPASNVTNGIKKISGAGNNSGRWEAATGNTPEWIMVDLGREYSIDRIELEWQSANSRSADYKMYYSINRLAWLDPGDISYWTELAYTTATNSDTSGASFDINTLSSATTARYIIVKSTRTVGNSNTYKLAMWNFKVYEAI